MADSGISPSQDKRRVPRRWARTLAAGMLGTIALVIAIVFFVFRPYSFGSPPQIPWGWGASLATRYKGNPAEPHRIALVSPPENPSLARTNSSNMHVDSYASDVHPRGGPLGNHPRIRSYAHGAFGGECATVAIDQRGNLVAVFGRISGFDLLLLSPDGLRTLARYSLPARASSKTLNLRKIMNDTSGGAYFFLDSNDRAVLVDAWQRLLVVAQKWDRDTVSFTLEASFDLSKILQSESTPGDVVTSVLPDWEGRYWFVSRQGLVGRLNPATGKTSLLRIDGEEIENSMAIDQNLVYVVTDHALYGLSSATDGESLKIIWRESYDRASHTKPGSLTLGSGTTPTLVGDEYVAIADNADPQMNVLVYRRASEVRGPRLVCKTPVFEPGRSTTDNSLVGIGRSLIVENNYGYDLFPTMMFGRTGAGGIARIDIAEDGCGCDIVWTNRIISQTTVPKLSLETGLLYLYTKDPGVGWGVDAYYLSALDFQTGATVFQILAGTGVSYDNNWAPITLGPNRCAYVGVLRGLVQICDGEVSDE